MRMDMSVVDPLLHTPHTHLRPQPLTTRHTHTHKSHSHPTGGGSEGRGVGERIDGEGVSVGVGVGVGVVQRGRCWTKGEFFLSRGDGGGAHRVDASHDATMDGRMRGRGKSERKMRADTGGGVTSRGRCVHHLRTADVRRRGVQHGNGHALLAQMCSMQSGCAMQEHETRDIGRKEPRPRHKRRPCHRSTSSSPPYRTHSKVLAAFATKELRSPRSSSACLVSPLVHPMANFELP